MTKIQKKRKKKFRVTLRVTLFKSIFGVQNLLKFKISKAFATPNSVNRAIGENWSQIDKDTPSKSTDLQNLRPPFSKNEKK